MPLTAIIAGSTNRAVTNHPHYENAQLRLRTKQLYQFGAYRSDAQVHNAVAAYRADHIILVQASCNRQSRYGCTHLEPFLLDKDNCAPRSHSA